MPVACFLQFNDEADQYAFGYVLRPGDATAHYGAIGILKRTIAKYAVLNAFAEPLMIKARRACSVSGDTEHVFGECDYETASWDEPRRVIFKAEVVQHPGREPKDNPRFVVTNPKSQSALISTHSVRVHIILRASIEG